MTMRPTRIILIRRNRGEIMKKIICILLVLLCVCGCSKKPEVGNLYIRTEYKGDEYIFTLSKNVTASYASEFEGGYVANLESGLINEQGRVAFIDKSGKIQNVIGVESDRYCFISDMAVFDEKLYVSVYSIAKGICDEKDAQNYEFSRLLDNLDNENMLQNVVKEQYRAELYVLDGQKFVRVASADGCRENKFCAGEKLEWTVGKIELVKVPSVVVSSFVVEGKYRKHTYIFGKNSIFESKSVSDELYDFVI